jgi:acyl carrier protein
MANKSRDEILVYVEQVVAGVTGIAAADLRPDMDLVEELELDSLALYEIVIELEEEYDLQISDEEIDRIKNLEDVVQYIANRQS